MNRQEITKYLTKAKDSFKTKKNLFIFSQAINSNFTFALKDFKDFKITEDLVKSYTGKYWQQEKDFKLKPNLTIQETEERINRIEKENASLLKVCEKDYIDNFNEVFSKEDFSKMLDAGRREGCYYCHITEDKINQLTDSFLLYKKSFRGWSLEVERFNSNLEYTKKNCTMACYWCNNAKTDEFTEEEFAKVGEVIEQIWEERLNDN